MKTRVLGLATGISLIFGLQLAIAAPMASPVSPVQNGLGQISAVEPVVYVRRGAAVVRGPAGGCVGGRRCVGGYRGGVCRSWAACR